MILYNLLQRLVQNYSEEIPSMDKVNTVASSDSAGNLTAWTVRKTMTGQTPTELLAAREKLIGYKTVVVELGEAATGLPGDHSQLPEYQSAIGSVQEATYSGPAFEGLKALFPQGELMTF